MVCTLPPLDGIPLHDASPCEMKNLSLCTSSIVYGVTTTNTPKASFFLCKCYYPFSMFDYPRAVTGISPPA